MDWTSIIVALITAVFSYLGVRQEIKKSNKKVVEGELCLLRTNILHIYNKNKEEEKITQLERQNLDQLYQAYEALNGNCFVKDLYDKMRNWQVV